MPAEIFFKIKPLLRSQGKRYIFHLHHRGNGLTLQKCDKILLFNEVLNDLHWNLAYKRMIRYDIFEMLSILKRLPNFTLVLLLIICIKFGLTLTKIL